MENTLEKLKCLNYEELLIRKSWKKVIGSAYFLIPDSNPHQQFKTFSLIVMWLLSLIKDFDESFQINQFDDSNTVVQNIIKELKGLNYQGNISASKLKLAYGEDIILVLDFLTDLALSKTNYMFLSESHHTHDDILEEPNHIFSEGDEKYSEEFAETVLSNKTENNEARRDATIKKHEMILAKIDPVEWRTELERVGPKLRGKIIYYQK